MEITEWYTLKAFTMPSSWVSFLGSLLIVGIIIRFLFRKELASIYVDAVLTLILTWKFSVIVTDFSIVIRHPLTILYFNGGMIGFIIGLLFMFASLWKKLRSRGFLEKDLHALFLSSILCQSFYQILMAFLNDAFLWQKGLTIIAFLCWIIVALWKRNASSMWHKQLLLLFFFSHMLIASLQPLGIWQLSVWISLLLILFTILLQPRRIKS